MNIESFLDHQKNRIFLWIPVLLSIGIGIYFGLDFDPPFYSVWISLGIIASLLSVYFFISQRSIRALCMVIILIGAGFLTAHIQSILKDHPMPHKSMGVRTISGILDALQDTPHGRRLEITVNTIDTPFIKTPFKVRLLCKVSPKIDLSSGDLLTLKAKLVPVGGPTYPGGYDFRKRGFFEGMTAVGFVLKIISSSPSPTKQSFSMKTLRNRLTNYLQNYLPEQTGAIAAALLTGETGGLSKTTRTQFSNSGLAHVLAISGLHLTLIGGLSFLFFRLIFGFYPQWLLRFSLFKISAVGAIGTTLFYLLIAGASIPTQRAFISFCLMMIAVLVDRNPLSLRLIAIAACIILMLKPESLTTPSFQMSFAAVVGLISIYEEGLSYWRTPIHSTIIRKSFFYMASIIISSAIASLATLPFTIYHFHKFSLQAILSNLMVIPLLTFWIMPAGIVTVVLIILGIQSSYLENLFSQGIQLMQKVAIWSSEFPGASISVSHLPLWGLTSFAIGSLWIIIWKHPVRWFGLIALLAFGFSFFDTQKPFLFVSSDAKVIGIVHNQKLLLSSSRKNSFLAESWAVRSGLNPDNIIYFKGKKSPCQNYVECFKSNCLIHLGSLTVAHVKNVENILSICEKADVLVSAEPLRWRRYQCTRPKIIIDRFDVFFKGAHMIIKDNDDLIVHTAKESQGNRPWTVGSSKSSTKIQTIKNQN